MLFGLLAEKVAGTRYRSVLAHPRVNRGVLTLVAGHALSSLVAPGTDGDPAVEYTETVNLTADEWIKLRDSVDFMMGTESIREVG